MPIALIGDIHGCVRHALAATAALQHHRRLKLDAIIQVGDFGAIADRARLAPGDRRFIADNPAQGDFFRLMDPSDDLRVAVDRWLSLAPPMLFISGNHEDDEWLASLHTSGRPIAAVDPAGVAHHVASGTIVTLTDGTRTAFLGGIDAPGWAFDLVDQAIARLMDEPAGSVDVLVTHDGPSGMSRGWHGRPQGSVRILQLIEQLQPTFHVSGHYHHVNGPRFYGRTTSYALAALVDPKADKWGRDAPNPTQRVGRGALGLLDAPRRTFECIADDWLADVHGDDLDLDVHLPST